MSNISKEELAAQNELYSKNNVLFEKLLATQDKIIEQQEKITNRLYNGMSREIADDVVERCTSCSDKVMVKLNDITGSLDSTDKEGTIATRLLGISKDAKANKGYAEKAMWFIGIVGFATIIITVLATVILRGIDNRRLFKTEIQEIVSELKTK